MEALYLEVEAVHFKKLGAEVHALYFEAVTVHFKKLEEQVEVL